MWSYIPNYFPLASSSCPAYVRYMREELSIEHSAYMALPPRAPRVRTIPLPCHSNILQLPPIPSFPIDFTSEFTPMTRSKLASTVVPLSTVIHIHDPASHVGEIHVEHGIRTALEAIHYVQAVSETPLRLPTYQDLSGLMKDQVEAAFLVRASRNMGRDYVRQVWSMFLRGDLHPNGPSGVDLLLGNTEVWGLDAGITPGICYLRVG